jgi:hypothetical protein
MQELFEDFKRKVWDTMNHDKVQCAGVKADTGERCTLRTDDSSGYCHKHREQLNKETEYSLMKCKDCPIRTCSYKGKGPGGLCFFEIADQVKDFDEQWKVYQAMRDQLKFNRLMIGRIERELSRRDLSHLGEEGDTTNTLMKNHQNLVAINGGQLIAFGTFMGWRSDKSDDSKVDERRKSLEKIFAREKEKDKEDEAEKKAVEKIVTV